MARFTEEEDRLIIAGRERRIPSFVIAHALTVLLSNVERHTVRHARAVTDRVAILYERPSLLPNNEPERAEESEGERQDTAFQQVMRAAIARGAERAHLGIKKDDTPFVGRFIHSPPMFSGCSSSSALCVDAAGIDPIGDSLLA